MAGPLTLNFSWTAVGNYPAGSNAWNGQPLALAPPQTYMTPDTKPAAEEINYEFGQIATDLTNLNNAIPVWNAHLFVGASSTLVVPAGVTWMAVEMVGGGGGGEGGKRGETGDLTLGIFPQGGGGAGSPLVTAIIPVVPGETLTFARGAGGAGGAANGASGNDGGTSVLSGSVSGDAVEAYGGAGCGSGYENNHGTGYSCGLTDTPGTVYTDIFAAFAPGATGVQRLAGKRPFPYSLGAILYGSADSFLSHANSNVPCSGGGTGAGNQQNPTAAYVYVAYPGANPVGSLLFGTFVPHVGGSPGTAGTTSLGNAWAGCAGGGGGGSAFGDGGGGGNGGSGSATNGTAATAGGSGGVGAGGGGGGCGGDGNSSGGASGAGGAGGDGACRIFWMERVAP